MTANGDKSDAGPGVSRPAGGHAGRKAAAFLILLVLLYVASPYFTFWRFTEALKSTERSRLESYVDFPAVRQSLKDQLRGKLPTPSARNNQDMFAGMVERLGPSLIDQLVDAFVTPDGLAALIADPEIAQEAKAKNPGAVAHLRRSDRTLDWAQVKYAFFTGPRQFLVDVDGTKLRFRFIGFGWKLRKVELAQEELKL